MNKCNLRKNLNNVFAKAEANIKAVGKGTFGEGH